MEDNNVQRFSEKSGAGSYNNLNGELNSQNDVRTVPEIMMADKGPKATKLMSNLTNVIEVKKRRLEEMERKYMETKNTISKLIAENDKLQQSYYEGSCVYLLFIVILLVSSILFGISYLFSSTTVLIWS